MALYLGFDIGTQGAKAIVYDSSTKRVASRGSFQYDIIKNVPPVPGRAEQAPSTWIEVRSIHCRHIGAGYTMHNFG